ncbi:MAG: cupin domain-containing protein [Pseudomonadota bacterium]
MQQYALTFPCEDRLKTLLTLRGDTRREHEVGTAFLPAGCRMPEEGLSQHPRHEVSIILDGHIETTSGGDTITLKAGDIVSIPTGAEQCTRVIKDTQLIYIFFDEHSENT